MYVSLGSSLKINKNVPKFCLCLLFFTYPNFFSNLVHSFSSCIKFSLKIGTSKYKTQFIIFHFCIKINLIKIKCFSSIKYFLQNNPDLKKCPPVQQCKTNVAKVAKFNSPKSHHWKTNNYVLLICRHSLTFHWSENAGESC